MVTCTVRLWLPDRPGALGQVASRIGAVRGSVIGIDILERGDRQAIDELTVELPSERLVDLLVSEINQVDGVSVESVRPAPRGGGDPGLMALEAAGAIVAARTPADLEGVTVEQARVASVSKWAAILDLDSASVRAGVGAGPSSAWLAAFIGGAPTVEHEHGPDDIAWAMLADGARALVVGREQLPYRASERRQLVALANIVSARLVEVERLNPQPSHATG